MGTATPVAGKALRSTDSEGRGVFRRVVEALLPVAVLGGILGVAYLGHQTDWQFSGVKQHAGQPATASEGMLPVVRFTPTTARAGLALPGHEARIEFDTADAVTAAGVDITPVWRGTLREQVSGAGEVGFDPTRIARLSPRAGGTARQVFKAAGDPVRAGELLALIESPDVGKAKTEFQQALVQTRLREKARDDLTAAKSATSPAQLREAEASAKEAGVRVLAAAQTLTNLGLPVKADDFRGLSRAEAVKRLRLAGVEDAAKDADRDELPSNLLPVRASFAGVVLSADVVAGEVVESGKTLFVVIDPSRVFITLHLGAEDARRVAVGQKTFFRPDGAGHEHTAAVVWVGTAANESTRTVPVRAEAENAAGSLRVSTLGRGGIVIREESKAVLVPHEAVQSFRGQAVVFVRDPAFLTPGGPKAFHVRVVQTGGRDEQNTEILSGLLPGDIVAGRGSARLLSELTRAAANR